MLIISVFQRTKFCLYQHVLFKPSRKNFNMFCNVQRVVDFHHEVCTRAKNDREKRRVRRKKDEVNKERQKDGKGEKESRKKQGKGLTERIGIFQWKKLNPLYCNIYDKFTVGSEENEGK